MKAQLSFFHDNGKFEATHEIEIPDGADKFHHEMTDRDGYVSRGWVPIPHPKKKVKKTVYLHVQKERGKTVYDVQIGTPILFGDDAVYPVEIEMEE